MDIIPQKDFTSSLTPSIIDANSLKITPNPFLNEFDLQFSSTRPLENVWIQINDVLGVEQEKKYIDQVTTGWNHFHWQGLQLKPGVYLIRLQVEGHQAVTKKIIKSF